MWGNDERILSIFPKRKHYPINMGCFVLTALKANAPIALTSQLGVTSDAIVTQELRCCSWRLIQLWGVAPMRHLNYVKIKNDRYNENYSGFDSNCFPNVVWQGKNGITACFNHMWKIHRSWRKPSHWNCNNYFNRLDQN